jgi:hypothetical protein
MGKIPGQGDLVNIAISLHPSKIMRLEKKTNVLVASSMVLAAALSLRAQGDPCLNRAVAVNVTTKQGQPVKGLTAVNFRGKFRGRPVDLVSAAYDTGPRRIVIVLDASGSMFDKWPIEISVAEDLLRSLPEPNSFALLIFAKRVEEKVDFRQGRMAVAGALKKLDARDWSIHKGPYGRTALLNTLVAALDLLQPARLGDAIYVITDGDDNASTARLSEVKVLFLAAGVRLFSLITLDEFEGRGRSAEERLGFSGLAELIQAAGGDYLAFRPGLPPDILSMAPRLLHITDRDRETMSTASNGFAREISEFYALQIKLRELSDKARDWQLEAGDFGEKNLHLKVMYPHKLAPCP